MSRTGLILMIIIFTGVINTLESAVLPAQENPLKIKLLFSGQTQNSPYRAESAFGYGYGGQLNYRLTQRLDFTFRVGYDYLFLHQDSVVREWQWAYWRERYIDWLFSGSLSPAQIDSFSLALEYVRFDSAYIGIFNPYQNLGELRFSSGLELAQALTPRLTFYTSLALGVTRYQRTLKMVEHWTKRYHFQWDSVKVANQSYTPAELERLRQFRKYYGADSTVYEFDYDYKARVTHFAPAKKGWRIFTEPIIGMRWKLSSAMDLDLAYTGVFYFSRKITRPLENLLGIKSSAMQWFPLQSKSMLTVGVTFNY